MCQEGQVPEHKEVDYPQAIFSQLEVRILCGECVCLKFFSSLLQTQAVWIMISPFKLRV